MIRRLPVAQLFAVQKSNVRLDMTRSSVVAHEHVHTTVRLYSSVCAARAVWHLSGVVNCLQQPQVSIYRYRYEDHHLSRKLLPLPRVRAVQFGSALEHGGEVVGFHPRQYRTLDQLARYQIVLTQLTFITCRANVEAVAVDGQGGRPL